ncbi:MAG: flagellar basal body-associated FliL family protein [Planctomycetota bacterium]|jgi:flagellar basal body-associated protein FliL
MAKEAAPEVMPVAERRLRVREVPLVSLWGLGLILALLVIQGLIFYFLFSTEHGLWGWFTTSGQKDVVGRTIDIENLWCELKPEQELGRGMNPKLKLNISLEMTEKNYINYKQTISRLIPWIRNSITNLCLERTRSQLHSSAGMKEFANDIKREINQKLQATEDVIREIQFHTYLFSS